MENSMKQVILNHFSTKIEELIVESIYLGEKLKKDVYSSEEYGKVSKRYKANKIMLEECKMIYKKFMLMHNFIMFTKSEYKYLMPLFIRNTQVKDYMLAHLIDKNKKDRDNYAFSFKQIAQ